MTGQFAGYRLTLSKTWRASTGKFGELICEAGCWVDDSPPEHYPARSSMVVDPDTLQQWMSASTPEFRHMMIGGIEDRTPGQDWGYTPMKCAPFYHRQFPIIYFLCEHCNNTRVVYLTSHDQRLIIEECISRTPHIITKWMQYWVEEFKSSGPPLCHVIQVERIFE